MMKATTLLGSAIQPRRNGRGRKLHRAMRRAYSRFEGRYPSLTCSLFDWHFLTHGADGVLRSVRFGPEEQTALALAEAWADQLAGFHGERKEEIVESMAPAIQEFVVLLQGEMSAEGLPSAASQPDAAVQVPALR